MVTAPAKAWRLLPHNADAAQRLARSLNVSSLVAQLLLNRGVEAAEDARRFLDAPLSGLHPPESLPGIPEAADRIRREGETVCGDREPTAADYSALAYTRAVIQETMRLYPPIWMLIRVAAKADEIDGKEIRPGDRIALFAYGAHHSPKYWENPEDFVPERWMGDAAKKRIPYTYLPFGGGKRSCIGGAMSQVENTLALSILLRRFRPEYVGPEPPGINATVTLTPKGGLPFKIRALS